MNLLDELRSEQEQKQRAVAHPRPHQVQGRPAGKAVREAMKTLQLKLSKLAADFNRLEIDTPFEFDVPSVGPLRDLHPHNFMLTVIDAQLPTFRFSFDCVGKKGLTHNLETAAERNAVLANLQSFNLQVQQDSPLAVRHSLLVKALVPVQLVFTPTPDGHAIRLSAQNLNRLGQDLFSINPSQVCEDLIEELGKLLLRRKNRFFELTGNELSAEARERLRSRLGDRAKSVSNPASTAPATRLGHVSASARQAPVLVNEHSSLEDVLDWNNAAGSSQAPAPAGGGDKIKAPTYAWIVIWDSFNPDPSESMAKRGPLGSAPIFPSSMIVRDGADFQLKDEIDRVRYSGMIIGSYSGIEPLAEFGAKHGCTRIEYQRDGRWEPWVKPLR